MLSAAAAEIRPDLYVRMLGGFAAIRSDGTTIELPKKAQALLCFLIVQRGRAASRDTLSGLLWSEASSAQSRHSLRQCLTTLRQRLPRRAATSLVIKSESLTLTSSPHFLSDLEAFERLIAASAAPDLAEAFQLYTGPLLLGLSLRHEPFADWLTTQRERLACLRLDLSERLARTKWNNGNVKVALAHARALLDEDPLREESSRLLMEILSADGQRGAALLEYARIKRRLCEELRVDPAPLTMALAEQIRRANQIRSATQSHEMLSAISSRTRVSRRASGALRVSVLPFKNWTGRRHAGPLVAVLADDVSTALACDRMLDVESFGNDLDVALPEVGCTPEYVVTGSIRDESPHLGVAIQLVCGRTRRCLWSDRFEIVDDPPEARNTLPLGIAARVAFAIRSLETRKTIRIPFEQMSVVQLVLVAAVMGRKDQRGNAAAVSMLNRAIGAEPDLGILHAALARCFHVQRIMGWLPPGDRRLTPGLDHAGQAVDLSSDDSEALWMAGLAFMNIGGDLAGARGLIDRSLSLNPSSVNARIAACFLDCQGGRVDMAIVHARRASRLNVDDTSHHVQKSAEATALFVAGDYEAADAACAASLLQRPGYAGALRIKIATASLLGRKSEAEGAARELLKRDPSASVARMRDYWKWLAPNAPDALDAKLQGWRRAGMPE